MAILRDIVGRIWFARGEQPGSDADDDGGLFPADPAVPVVLVTVFGVAATALDAALDRALTGLSPNSRVVCVTDQPDFATLRRRGIAFEYLPPPSSRSIGLADARDWKTYLTERYDLVLAKWRPGEIVTMGLILETFLSGDDEDRQEVRCGVDAHRRTP